MTTIYWQLSLRQRLFNFMQISSFLLPMTLWDRRYYLHVSNEELRCRERKEVVHGHQQDQLRTHNWVRFWNLCSFPGPQISRYLLCLKSAGKNWLGSFYFLPRCALYFSNVLHLYSPFFFFFLHYEITLTWITSFSVVYIWVHCHKKHVSLLSR